MKRINNKYFLLLTLLILSGPLAAQNWPPKVPFQYGLGMKKYDAMCTSCHGKWAEGTDEGPPLLHPYYKSSHHSDASFQRAIMKGARAHHWNFGDMPPIKGATAEDVKGITLFVRWLQKQKGIE